MMGMSRDLLAGSGEALWQDSCTLGWEALGWEASGTPASLLELDCVCWASLSLATAQGAAGPSLAESRRGCQGSAQDTQPITPLFAGDDQLHLGGLYLLVCPPQPYPDSGGEGEKWCPAQ